MKPLDLACRRCAVQPGENCIHDGGPWGTSYEMEYFHAERIEDAATWTTGATPPSSKDEFTKAVEDTGLV